MCEVSCHSIIDCIQTLSLRVVFLFQTAVHWAWAKKRIKTSCVLSHETLPNRCMRPKDVGDIEFQSQFIRVFFVVFIQVKY